VLSALVKMDRGLGWRSGLREAREGANEIVFLHGCPPATRISALAGKGSSGMGETAAVHGRSRDGGERLEGVLLTREAKQDL
jgi:hypothetical protein